MIPNKERLHVFFNDMEGCHIEMSFDIDDWPAIDGIAERFAKDTFDDFTDIPLMQARIRELLHAMVTYGWSEHFIVTDTLVGYRREPLKSPSPHRDTPTPKPKRTMHLIIGAAMLILPFVLIALLLTNDFGENVNLVLWALILQLLCGLVGGALLLKGHAEAKPAARVAP